ncbi:MAG: hypothetical protein EA426_11845 [Spirochaetaceae bacterium]|nr:MAG: hypothetical protein EA426_11845 [Spirochaetaceae bacterium]
MTMKNGTKPSPPGGLVDAYMHVGSPRFGTTEQALETCDRWGIKKAVLVLGPGVPDIRAIYDAARARPDSIRTVGVPFGDTAERRRECVELCIEAGAVGVRLQGNEPIENPAILDLIGKAGLWVYATDPLRSAQHAAIFSEWLESYPTARIAAPHFLRPTTAPLETADAERLVAHPRFFAIFSRHGGVGSAHRYPHTDLRPWVERVIELCGRERILWGSEYPVLYWRDERIDAAVRWITELGIEIDEPAFAAYAANTADALFFSGSPPTARLRELPEWLAGFTVDRPVLIAENGPIALPGDVYEPLFAAFHAQHRPESSMTFSEFCVEQLRVRAAQLAE